jgi:uncharacterized protein (DUF305 family)
MAVIAVGLMLIGGGLAVAVAVAVDRIPVTPATDSVDAGFARDMAAHHLQGVQMANLVAERSEDPEVESLGFDISATQTNQAGRMQGWLALWDVPPTGGEPMAWMADAGHGGHGGQGMATMGSRALMPGMATEAELANLRSLTGPAFDVEFLRLMIRHHQGGFGMAQYAAEHAELGAVQDLAESIEASQSFEVDTMTDMLTARGGTPLPAP